MRLPGSARVLEKAGMRREQHGVEDSWHTELGWVDGYQYAMLAREWQALHRDDGRV
jgi:RimJ/RimL family protein N-acetyltransferase